MSYKNPFSDLFANFAGSCAFNDSFNIDKAVAAGRSNAKAFAEASKAAADGFQAIAQRQAKIAQEAIAQYENFFKDASSSAKSPEAAVAKQAEYLNSAFKSANANLNELGEIATKSAKEANKIISERVTSSLSELASAANSNNSANPARKNKNEAA
jgi:phasin family protein